jgi:hypothetical protein
VDNRRNDRAGVPARVPSELTSEDRGQGDVAKFSAEDLEKLYRQGGLDIAAQIQGASLNKILDVATYEEHAWYIITERGVEKM